MNKELIPSKENSLSEQTDNDQTTNLELTEHTADSLFAQRIEQIEQLHPFVSLKFYYAMKEKIVREQATARKLLRLEDQKQETLDQFSFILNPSYFEQKTLN